MNLPTSAATKHRCILLIIYGNSTVIHVLDHGSATRSFFICSIITYSDGHMDYPAHQGTTGSVLYMHRIFSFEQETLNNESE